ncbi:hypothetical protein QJQ45_029429 [Haematococcus lacustris]|nr:hypothetical protein QJQ45_029429 [Haematococcus lacustris]
MLQALRVRLGAVGSLPLRGLAPSSKKGGKDKGPRRPGQLSTTKATGCALMKGEEDPPLKLDSEYPDWLWKLLDPQPTGKELFATYQGHGLSMQQRADASPKSVFVLQLHRLWRQQNKARIKESNAEKAKG